MPEVDVIRREQAALLLPVVTVTQLLVELRAPVPLSPLRARPSSALHEHLETRFCAGDVHGALRPRPTFLSTGSSFWREER